jgi:hypothetical protein
MFLPPFFVALPGWLLIVPRHGYNYNFYNQVILLRYGACYAELVIAPEIAPYNVLSVSNALP